MPIMSMPKGSWAGSEDSLRELIKMAEMAESAVQAQGLMGLAYSGDDTDDEEEEPNRLLTISENTAVISITGSLVNSNSYWNRYFGLTGYPEIKEALIEAANDSEVNNILMQIDSGGGSVSGVFELAEFIKKVDTLIKPIEAINTGTMASAAYLLGSQARKVHSSEMSQSGSIGVIMIHQEYSKHLEEKGIKVNVIRAGKHKALVNPYEKLTDEARAGLQKDADYIHDKFIGSVADGRGMSYTTVKETIAEGDMYYTEEALRLGLVDNITSIDKLVAELNDRSREDKRDFIAQVGDSVSPNLNASSNGEIEMAKKKVQLSTENQAALASGVPVESLDISDDGSSPEESTSEEANTNVAAEAADEGTGTEESLETEGTEGSDAESNSATELTTFLKEQNQELNTKSAEMALKLSKVEAELASATSNTKSLEKIVVESCTRMSVPMGNSGTDYSHMTGSALVAAYADLNAKFCDKFPVGGKVKVETDPQANSVPQSSNRSFAVAAAKI